MISRFTDILFKLPLPTVTVRLPSQGKWHVLCLSASCSESHVFGIVISLASMDDDEFAELYGTSAADEPVQRPPAAPVNGMAVRNST